MLCLFGLLYAQDSDKTSDTVSFLPISLAGGQFLRIIQNPEWFETRVANGPSVESTQLEKPLDALKHDIGMTFGDLSLHS